jgi:DNA polymerase III psi subunit
MLKNSKGTKITANQAAKLIIYNSMDSWFYNLDENLCTKDSKLTDTEYNEIIRHLEKHRRAICKKLGLYEMEK